METKTLGEIATYINGYAFKPTDRGTVGLPIIRIQDLTGNGYDLAYYNGEYPSKIEINDGDILISWSGSLGVYEWNKGKALLNQHIFKVVFDKEPVEKKYFIYAIKKSLASMSAQTHGATMKHITKKDFDKVVIPFPSIVEQQTISNNLAVVEELIENYKKQLEKLDALAKSRFVELFSDVYEEQSLGDVCAKITDGEHGTVERYTSGRLYLMARNISMDNDLDLSEVSYISEKDHQRIFKRCNPEQGDLLLVCVGATIGKVSIVPEMEEFSMARSVALIKPKRELLDSHYLLAALQSEQVKKQIKNSIHSSAQGGLYTSSIKRIRIPLPPIEIQKRFSEEINKIGKSKSVIQKSLDEAQLLFDSLMQEYFG